MTDEEIIKLLKNGENSKIEFKSDDIDNYSLSKEIVAFANLKGGTIFLGVNGNAEIRGMIRGDNEERIMNICSDLIFPRIIPVYEEKMFGEKKLG